VRANCFLREEELRGGQNRHGGNDHSSSSPVLQCLSEVGRVGQEAKRGKMKIRTLFATRGLGGKSDEDFLLVPLRRHLICYAVSGCLSLI